MVRDTPPDIAKLFSPVDIPAFSYTKDSNLWKWGGGQVSKLVYPGDCAFNGSETIKAAEGNFLSLPEYAAIMMLAVDSFQGADLQGVSKESIEGAKEIFYAALHLSLTTSNQGGRLQYFFGEGLNDIFEITSEEPVDGSHVGVTWYTRPAFSETGELIKDGGGIPLFVPNDQGVAVQTSRGYLNPDTGYPFETAKITGEEDVCFLSKVIEKALEIRGGSDDLKLNAFTGIPEDFDAKELENHIGELLSFWKPLYRFSHDHDGKTLIQYGEELFKDKGHKRMVTVVGIDESPSFFSPSVAYDGAHCGYQIRGVRRA